jgi:SpoVK/Ycf46/Vps4 family AAA+-type ATPase
MTNNFASSDIELIVTQAARMAVSENKDMIDEIMLIESIRKSKSSITQEELQDYQTFREMERR